MRPKICLSLLAIAMVGAAPASAADCPGADLPAGAPETVAVRAAVVCLTNVERANAGLAALVPEGRLEEAAQAYSGLLVRDQFFAHVTPEGSALTNRLRAYTGWRRVGENLAWGEGSRGTPRAIVAAWMASPGHRANILSDQFTEVGIGMVPGTPINSNLAAATYAAEYGARASDTPPVPVEGAASAPATTRPKPRSESKPRSKRKPARRARKVARRCRHGKVRRRTRAHGRTVVRCVARSSHARV